MTDAQQMAMIKTQMLGMLAEENVEYVSIANKVAEAMFEASKLQIDGYTTQEEKGAALIGVGIAMIDMQTLADYIEG